MSVSLGRSLCNGSAEYIESFDGRYYLCQLSGRAISCCSPGVIGVNVDLFSDIFMTVKDGTDIVPRMIRSIPDLRHPIKTISSTSHHYWIYLSSNSLSHKFQVVRVVSLVALEVLSAAALAGVLGLVDLGRIAAKIGCSSLALVPAIRVAYISFLVNDIGVSAIRVVNNYKTYERTSGQLTKVTKNVDEKKRLIPQEKIQSAIPIRRDIMNIFKNVVVISYQVACLAAITNPIVLALGVVDPILTLAVGALNSQSMRDWYGQSLDQKVL